MKAAKTPTPVKPSKGAAVVARLLSAPWWTGLGVLVALAAIGISLGAWLDPKSPAVGAQPKAGSSVPSPTASAAATGRIIFPRDHRNEGSSDLIDQKVSASGVAHIPAGHRLWLFVGFPDGGNWYPANGDPENGARPDHSITINPDGTWKQENIEFGDDKQKGETFDLRLADVGPAGVKQLTKYFADQDNTGQFNGIERGRLASDIHFLYPITVQRAPR
jgi:hypothetical protein